MIFKINQILDDFLFLLKVLVSLNFWTLPLSAVEIETEKKLLAFDLDI